MAFHKRNDDTNFSGKWRLNKLLVVQKWNSFVILVAPVPPVPWDMRKNGLWMFVRLPMLKTFIPHTRSQWQWMSRYWPFPRYAKGKILNDQWVRKILNDQRVRNILNNQWARKILNDRWMRKILNGNECERYWMTDGWERYRMTNAWERGGISTHAFVDWLIASRYSMSKQNGKRD